MDPKWMLAILVFFTGMLQPVQAGMNARFRVAADHPLQAGTLNMWIGAIAILLVLLIMRQPPPKPSHFAAAPWWSMLGGCIGATIVVTMLIAAPKLGAALLVALFVTGQLTSSITIDHFGLIGYPVRPASMYKIAGIALLIVGVILVERGNQIGLPTPPA